MKITLIYIFSLCFVLISSCKNPVDKIVEINNKIKGKQLDEVTTFDSVNVDEQNHLFSYFYSIKNHKGISHKIDLEDKLFEKYVQENLKLKVNILNPEFKTLHERKYDISFRYYSINDKENIANVKFVRQENGYEFTREKSEWNTIVDAFYTKFKK